DNLLAEFVSVVDAVQCAVAVQKEIKSRNDELPENRQMQFRIGINLGDVIQEEERIYGDGVNIAARLEGIADPGGICISKTAFDQIETKLPYGYEFLGDQTVKNIPKPVGAYRVLMEPRVTVAGKPEKEKLPPKRRKTLLVGVATLFIVAVAVGIWQFYTRRPSVEPASVEKMAFPLPEKPSIAVLAFDNLSGDPEQEYFSDGIAENIITVLSKVDALFVIARNSSFTYTGKPVKVHQISQELGVKYVLEGSVQKSGDRVRISAQLIDAIDGQHLWAEKYDRDFKDIFEIQDDITVKIVNALRIKLTAGEQVRLSKSTKNPDVFLKTLEMHSLINDGTEESLMRFGQLAQEVIDIEPESSLGYTQLGWYQKFLANRGISPRENIKKAFMLAQKALSMDEADSFAHTLMGTIYLLMRKYEEAISSGKRAVELQPNHAMAHALLGSSLNIAGRVDEAIAHCKQAIRLNPFPAYYYYHHLGLCYLQNEQYEDALAEFKKALQRAPNAIFNHITLAGTYSLAGREDEARASAAKALELDPKLSVKSVSKMLLYKNEAYTKLLIDAVRKAGFPE
ncbi:MAG: adenylate/guanylate cyclase domain-containing protein, partial [Deltaproteobacteria bacterium]